MMWPFKRKKRGKKGDGAEPVAELETTKQLLEPVKRAFESLRPTAYAWPSWQAVTATKGLPPAFNSWNRLILWMTCWML